MATARSIPSPWPTLKRLKINFTSKPAHMNRSFCTTPPNYEEDPLHLTRPQEAIAADLLNLASERNIPIPNGLAPASTSNAPRLPRSVQALYLAPLRRTPTHGVPVCNLQLRSYSARNLEFMADFALRAAYYLNLPARGPVSLPRITERWTVPRSNFVHKKSQENFERITMRRLVQIQDGHPEVVQRWLQFVRRWCWYGVGMKADVWEHEGMEVTKGLESEEAVRSGLESVDWELFGRRKGLETNEAVDSFLAEKGFGGRETAKADGSRSAMPS